MRSDRRLRTVLAALLATTLAATVAACSSDESATTTTAPRRSTTTTTTTTIAPGSQAPLQPDWAWQSGAADDDTLESATGRRDAVLAVGGAHRGLAPVAPPGSTLITLASADGTLRSASDSPVDAADDLARAVGAGSDGTALACGSISSAATAGFSDAADAWCAPVTEAGALGELTIGGSEGEEIVNGTALTADSGYAYVAASTDGLYPGAEDPTGGFLGERDALLLRTDPTGAPRWARQFGTQGNDSANGVTTTADGDAAVAGDSEDGNFGFDDGSERRGGQDAWAARFDPSGNQRWLTPFGTPGRDSARTVASGGDASRGTEAVVAAGSTDGTVASGAPGSAAAAGGLDVLVAAFDAGGRQQWITQLGSPADDEATGAVIDGQTLYVAGTAGAPIVGAERVDVPGGPTNSPGGGRDGFLSAYDLTTGTWQWTALFGSTGDDRVNGLTLTDDGHLVVVGTTSGTLAATQLAGATDGFAVAFPITGASGGASSAV